MSIEIREIVIRANITEPGAALKQNPETEFRRKKIVDDCVRRVLLKLAKRPLR